MMCETVNLNYSSLLNTPIIPVIIAAYTCSVNFTKRLRAREIRVIRSKINRSTAIKTQRFKHIGDRVNPGRRSTHFFVFCFLIRPFIVIKVRLRGR